MDRPRPKAKYTFLTAPAVMNPFPVAATKRQNTSCPTRDTAVIPPIIRGWLPPLHSRILPAVDTVQNSPQRFQSPRQTFHPADPWSVQYTPTPTSALPY